MVGRPRLKQRREPYEDRCPRLLTRFHPRVWPYRRNSNRDKPWGALASSLPSAAEFAAEGFTHIVCHCPRCRMTRLRPISWLPRISMGLTIAQLSARLPWTAERIPGGYVVKDAVFGGRGRGSQWLGGRSLPVHPLGMVSLRQHETRMVPGDVTWTHPGVPIHGSKIRIRVPSFGAVVMGCQFGNMPPGPPVPAKRRTAHVVPVVCWHEAKAGG